MLYTVLHLDQNAPAPDKTSFRQGGEGPYVRNARRSWLVFDPPVETPLSPLPANHRLKVGLGQSKAATRFTAHHGIPSDPKKLGLTYHIFLL